MAKKNVKRERGGEEGSENQKGEQMAPNLERIVKESLKELHIDDAITEEEGNKEFAINLKRIPPECIWVEADY